MKTYKFGLGDMSAIALAFVVTAVTIGVGATVISGVRDTQSATGSGSYAYNASTQGLSSINTLSGWLPTVAIVAASAVVLGLIIRYLGGVGQ